MKAKHAPGYSIQWGSSRLGTRSYKVGNQALFLDPDSHETVLTLDGFAPRVHELLVAPDRAIAYVPIYGDGIHGKNPYPGHLVALFDLEARRHMGDVSTYPHLAPHGLRWGP